MGTVQSTYTGTNKVEKFWHARAARYNALAWTTDEGYLDAILQMGAFTQTDLVLDVGVGTGTVAQKVSPHVKHVIGVDISESMLTNGKWEGISFVKWDIREPLFTQGTFDKVVARMVFHHILEGLDTAMQRCHEALSPGGRIIVAEGLPPSDDPHVISWYSEMFKLKEDRLTFTEQDLTTRLARAGFRNVETYTYLMKGFSIGNWLANSGLPKQRQEEIMRLHRSADQKLRDAYCMRCVGEDCLIDAKNVVLAGQK